MRMNGILVKPGEKPLEPWEKFKINTLNGEYTVSPEGVLLRVSGEEADGFAYRRAINHGINRKPSLTLRQKSTLKALYELGLRWLVRTIAIHATPDEPIKRSWSYHWDGPSINVCSFTDCLDTLNYTDAINIAQILEDNNVPFIKDPC